MYDSTLDTINHIRLVQANVLTLVVALLAQVLHHDESSLLEPEKSFYDEYRPILSALPFGSDAYLMALGNLKPAVDHHYQRNRHHPEHFVRYECGGCFKEYPAEMKGQKCPACTYDIFEQVAGINGMTLLDLLEMVADWKAAIDRSGGTGSVLKSIELNRKRFNISDQLADVLANTVRTAGWE